MFRVFSFINAAMLLVLGAVFLVSVKALRGVGVDAINDAGRVELHAMYGGLELALGIVLVMLTLASRYEDVFTLSLAIYAGLFAARLVGSFVFGTFAVHWWLLMIEALFIVGNSLLLYACRNQ